MKRMRSLYILARLLPRSQRSSRAPAYCSRQLHSKPAFSSQHPALEQELSIPPETGSAPPFDLKNLPSPPPTLATSSPKLAALHARLDLPSKLPLTTLSRTLIDPTADSAYNFNNSSFETLGNCLLGYYCSEQLIVQYPRLPSNVLESAVFAYSGPPTLAEVVKEWGIEYAEEPGGEVDPGLLQFRRSPVEKADPIRTTPQDERARIARLRKTDEVGRPVTSPENASAGFVRALAAAVYLHAGREASKKFIRDHVLSRQLSIASLFSFKEATRDLARLCAREGLARPVARLLSETGRLSRHPVFVVGVYSGQDKLGEGQGASLDEARYQAAVSALMGWYLYSPEDYKLPSMTENSEESQLWRPAVIDGGEVVI